MAGLGPAIHVFQRSGSKTWMPGTRPGMTQLRDHQSILIFAAFATAVHFSMSAAIILPYSSPLVATTSSASALSFSLTSGDFVALMISASIFFTIAGGVPAGAS